MRLLFLLSFFCALSLFSKEEPAYMPWLTGPLLAPTGKTVGKGRTNWEPYLYVTKTNEEGVPPLFTLNPLVLIQHGFTDYMDVKIVPSLFYNTSGGAHSTRLGDFPLTLGFQALREDMHSWKPDLRVIIEEIFPTGEYEKLNPKKNGTDNTGGGSFTTAFGTAFQKLFSLDPHHWLRLRLYLKYFIPTPVRVKGFNTYGGGYGTSGKAYPGQFFLGIFAFEYTLNQNWVLALDIQNQTFRKTKFTGKKGVTAKGEVAEVGEKWGFQWSYAPAIEYNFNENLGIVGGVWFTGGVKNRPDFFSYVIAVNYYH